MGRRREKGWTKDDDSCELDYTNSGLSTSTHIKNKKKKIKVVNELLIKTGISDSRRHAFAFTELNSTVYLHASNCISILHQLLMFAKYMLRLQICVLQLIKMQRQQQSQSQAHRRLNLAKIITKYNNLA